MLGKIRKIYSIVSTLLIIAVVIVAFLLVGVRLIGFEPYTVLSGSMEPKYHVGSIIYVAKVTPDELSVGDPLTYRIDNTVVTHEIVEIIDEGSPSRTLIL